MHVHQDHPTPGTGLLETAGRVGPWVVVCLAIASMAVATGVLQWLAPFVQAISEY